MRPDSVAPRVTYLAFFLCVSADRVVRTQWLLSQLIDAVFGTEGVSMFDGSCLDVVNHQSAGRLQAHTRAAHARVRAYIFLFILAGRGISGLLQLIRSTCFEEPSQGAPAL